MKALEPQRLLSCSAGPCRQRAGVPLVRAALKDGLMRPRLAAAGLGDIGDADDADALIAPFCQTDDALAERASQLLDDPRPTPGSRKRLRGARPTTLPSRAYWASWPSATPARRTGHR